MAYFLTEDRIILSLHSLSRDGVLKELAERVEKVCPGLAREAVFQALQQREKLGSTGISNGVAIPHGHLSILNTTEFFFALSREGLSFGAYNGKPTHIFFLVLAPEAYPWSYLQSLGQIARFLKDAEIKKRLLKARTAGEIREIISEAEKY